MFAIPESGVVIPKICDPRGNLSFVENITHLPFDIKRVEWVYDLPGGAILPGLASLTGWRLVVALSGSLVVATDNGLGSKCSTRLSSPDCGLLIAPLTWYEFSEPSTNTVIMTLCSEEKPQERTVTSYRTFSEMITHEAHEAN